MKHMTFALCAICGIAPMVATIASGQTAALTSVDQTYIRSMTGSAGYGYSLGWEFEMTQNAQVTSLGLLDLGFSSDHEVGIWTTGGVLLGNATVSESATPDSSGFAWATLGADINLSAGQDYVISAWYPTTSGSCDDWVVFGAAPVTASAVDYINAELGGLTTSFNYPNNANPAFNAGVFGPNFQYTTTAVPEPSTLALAALGASACFWRLRRRNA
jgi:hypothetical protein